jgi:hypothetical protein
LTFETYVGANPGNTSSFKLQGWTYIRGWTYIWTRFANAYVTCGKAGISVYPICYSHLFAVLSIYSKSGGKNSKNGWVPEVPSIAAVFYTLCNCSKTSLVDRSESAWFLRHYLVTNQPVCSYAVHFISLCVG